MINLNYTLFIQIMVFFAVLWVLTRFLFRPVLKILDERTKKIEGLNKKGKEIEKEIERKTEVYKDSLKGAKQEALKVKDDLKKDALKEEKEEIMAVTKKAKEIIEDKRKEMYKDTELAKKEMKRRIEENSLNIAEKVLGRRIE